LSKTRGGGGGASAAMETALPRQRILHRDIEIFTAARSPLRRRRSCAAIPNASPQLQMLHRDCIDIAAKSPELR
jgi:hypothetical protein